MFKIERFTTKTNRYLTASYFFFKTKIYLYMNEEVFERCVVYQESFGFINIHIIFHSMN